MIKLVKNKKKKTINPSQMEDGQIGVIVSWVQDEEIYKGRVVQAHGDQLITIGGKSSRRWTNRTCLTDPQNRVKLLKPGKKYTIQI